MKFEFKVTVEVDDKNPYELDAQAIMDEIKSTLEFDAASTVKVVSIAEMKEVEFGH